jgi:glycosyltransferase involved in cell wall biosynthesis
MSLQQGLPPFKEGQEIDMVIAHWCLFAPGRSGMYETVKELMQEEMKMDGVLAGIVHPADPKGGKSDGWITTQSHGWAHENATIHCSHYFMSGYSTMQKPRVMVIHGTPEACYEAEREGGSYSSVVLGIQNLDAGIVFNKRQYAYWKPYDTRDVLHNIDKGIDLTRYTPRGMQINVDGEPAIGVGEVQRRGGIKLPLIPYWAMNEYHKTNEKARLHHWGIGEGNERAILELIMHKSGFDRWLGKYGLRGFQMFPENWYRGCDMLISPSLYGDPSRVHFEAMACGCPVIDWNSSAFFGDSHATMQADAMDPYSMTECIAKLYDRLRANPRKVKQEARKTAETYYDMKNMAAQFVEILRKVQAEYE